MEPLVKDDTPWDHYAACQYIDAELWFPRQGMESESTKAAKKICAECPVLKQCEKFILDYENKHGPTYGTYAGLTATERYRKKVGTKHGKRTAVPYS